MWRTPLAGKRHPPLIVIVGPTAVGKTGLALQLAETMRGEIIGADSRQIYRFMDIGTAKPSRDEQARVPHYLIDLIDPDDNLTLARYQRLATETINDIHERRKIPFLVGGTGQYITAVTEGWSIPEVPPNDQLRLELEAFAEREGVGRLYDRLLETDPQAAAKIHPNNVRRVIRALEVYSETGEKISDLQRKSPPPYAILELGLRMERLNLYERADRRVDSMIEKGFLEEARYLLDSGYARTLPSMSGLGYGQLAAHILDNLPLETAIHDTKIATHDFIRRQLTWFRGHDNGILWHNVEGLDVYALTQFCVRWLNNEA
jgi:tRNA dimethylallyltransferase